MRVTKLGAPVMVNLERFPPVWRPELLEETPEVNDFERALEKIQAEQDPWVFMQDLARKYDLPQRQRFYDQVLLVVSHRPRHERDALISEMSNVFSTKMATIRGDLARVVFEPVANDKSLAKAILTEDEGPKHLTELGNTKRLVRRHGDNLHYVYPWKKWLVWDGQRWRRDESGEVERLAKETVASIYGEAAEAPTTDKRQGLAVWAMKSEKENMIRRGMIELAKSEIPVPVVPSQLDSDPWALNCANGTLDLRTGNLRPHARGDLITKLAPVAYDANAESPLWEAFLDRILGGNRKLIWFLQRAVGYTLTGNTTEQVFFLLYGTGNNGKTKFVETVQAMLGDYAQQTRMETFMVKYGDQIPEDVARLAGARFIAAVEAEEGRRLAESLVKHLTGGDMVAARHLYSGTFEYKPEFKIWLAANHKPVIRGTDPAMWRRVRLVPFTVTIPEEERDKGLLDKLVAELPGILRWAVDGCLGWQRDGLEATKEIKQATLEYRSESDQVGPFLDEMCVADEHGRVGATDLYQRYEAWAKANGEYLMTRSKFGGSLTEKGFRAVKVQGYVQRYGLRFR